MDGQRSAHLIHVIMTRSIPNRCGCPGRRILYSTPSTSMRYSDVRQTTDYFSMRVLTCAAPSSIGNKAVVCALSASYISTFAGYPVSCARFLMQQLFVLMNTCVLVGLSQVTVANYEDPHFSSSHRPTCLPRRRDRRLLQRALDPPHDHILRPYVPSFTDEALDR